MLFEKKQERILDWDAEGFSYGTGASEARMRKKRGPFPMAVVQEYVDVAPTLENPVPGLLDVSTR